LLPRNVLLLGQLFHSIEAGGGSAGQQRGDIAPLIHTKDMNPSDELEKAGRVSR
jgi:hypothetical protein